MVTDAGPSPITLMHGAGKFGLASLRNLDQLPPTGAVVIAALLKIVNGSGSPLRVPRQGSARCSEKKKA
jgi:kynurenine formamidase